MGCDRKAGVFAGFDTTRRDREDVQVVATASIAAKFADQIRHWHLGTEKRAPHEQLTGNGQMDKDRRTVGGFLVTTSLLL